MGEKGYISWIETFNSRTCVQDQVNQNIKHQRWIRGHLIVILRIWILVLSFWFEILYHKFTMKSDFSHSKYPMVKTLWSLTWKTIPTTPEALPCFLPSFETIKSLTLEDKMKKKIARPSDELEPTGAWILSMTKVRFAIHGVPWNPLIPVELWKVSLGN